jgi:hypothetical protein
MKEALRDTELSSLIVEDFRKIGIRRIYTECRSEGTAEGLCREKAKRFAGLTDDRQLKKVLKDARSILDGVKDPDQDAYQNYLFSIQYTMELLEYAHNHHQDSLIERIKSLKKAIQDDSGLSESQKQDLFSKIPPGID